MKTGYNNLNLLVILLIACFMSSSCKTMGMSFDRPEQTTGISKILILPFNDVSSLHGSVNTICHLCGHAFMTGFVPEDAPYLLTSQLVSILEKNMNFSLVHSEGSKDIISGQVTGADNRASYLKLYSEIGKRADADAVLIGHVFRYKDRKGRSLSVESPASVAFDLHLIHVQKGEIIWYGRFDETQRPLSENLLELDTFIKRGGIWVTAEQMSQAGLEDMMRRFVSP